MAGTKDGAKSARFEIKLTPGQIGSIVESVTEELIEHRATEIVAERVGALDDVARKAIETEIYTRLADRGVRAARHGGLCGEFERMWASIMPADAPYPRDNTGKDCRGWKLTEDGEHETHRDHPREMRPARKGARDMWRLYNGVEYRISDHTGLYLCEGPETDN